MTNTNSELAQYDLVKGDNSQYSLGTSPTQYNLVKDDNSQFQLSDTAAGHSTNHEQHHEHAHSHTPLPLHLMEVQGNDNGLELISGNNFSVFEVRVKDTRSIREQIDAIPSAYSDEEWAEISKKLSGANEPDAIENGEIVINQNFTKLKDKFKQFFNPQTEYKLAKRDIHDDTSIQKRTAEGLPGNRDYTDDELRVSTMLLPADFMNAMTEAHLNSAQAREVMEIWYNRQGKDIGEVKNAMNRKLLEIQARELDAVDEQLRKQQQVIPAQITTPARESEDAGAGNPDFAATTETERAEAATRDQFRVDEGTDPQFVGAHPDDSKEDLDLEYYQAGTDKTLRFQEPPSIEAPIVSDFPPEIKSLIDNAHLNPSQISEVRQLLYKNQEMEIGDISDLVRNKIKEFAILPTQPTEALRDEDILATITSAKPPEPKKILGITIKSSEDESARSAREVELKKALAQSFSLIYDSRNNNIPYERKINLLKNLLTIPHARDFILKQLQEPKERPTEENVSKLLKTPDISSILLNMSQREREEIAHRYVQYSNPDILARQLLDPRYRELLLVVGGKFYPSSF